MMTWTDEKIARSWNAYADDDDRALGAALLNLRARAHTLQSLAIEARTIRCRNCDARHFTWQCPEVLALLMAEEPAPNDAPGGDCPEHGPYADDECPKD